MIKKVKEENKEYQIANEQFKDENEQLYKDNERLTNEIAKNENDNMIFLKENEKLKRSIIKSQDDKSNNFKIIGKMSLIIKTLRKELQNVVNEKTSHIPFDLLPSELITENPDEELTMESIINWYNNRIEYLTKEVNKLDQVKRYVNKKLREASISFDDRDLLLNIEKLNNYHENLSKSNTSVADDDTEKSSTYSSNTKSIKSNNESNS
ncbi:hypothetical protein TRFO_29885 [Tritrichomonas foetus]|uniref:Uncharacterized protein n=1 Tax=Tritrichomonas foetus TaxID=1144522 RepID=A0A1J4JWJ9_9EUKA|nr:hypothetical protein TRFO_29885 [Tritrichomonas foetus]|eukprot:OHT02824.1 hypothetical protein TRFO_29885 [Tritrichomonas foetus]